MTIYGHYSIESIYFWDASFNCVIYTKLCYNEQCCNDFVCICISHYFGPVQAKEFLKRIFSRLSTKTDDAAYFYLGE